MVLALVASCSFGDRNPSAGKDMVVEPHLVDGDYIHCYTLVVPEQCCSVHTDPFAHLQRRTDVLELALGPGLEPAPALGLVPVLPVLVVCLQAQPLAVAVRLEQEIWL